MMQKNQKLLIREMLITYCERLPFRERTMGNKRCRVRAMKIIWMLVSFHLLNQASAHLMATKCTRAVSQLQPPLGQGHSTPFQHLGVANQVR
ncbi:Uncharacterized protein TCM_045607 [Theobroma cacao]|uniref:Uncharacterized protein n=1 Tax=Theobroma cacao TaxID=3641 RepID=A0A061FTE1_THECC|nr:Uncharacterized protein TCM_045607 [Theobroma cacao]